MFQNGLSTLLDQYDVFFFDLWGVTHNGKVPFPGALDSFKNLKKEGKAVFLLSNAPRMPEPAIAKLTEMGIDRDYYHDLYTSGYECHLHLKNRPNNFYQNLGHKLYHVGPERDRNLFTPLREYTPVSKIEEADFLLVTGTDVWDRTLESYQDELNQALKHNLPLVCANPDKRVMHGEDTVICSGAIASKYKDMGGTVCLHGKPDPIVYQVLHSITNETLDKNIDKSRILMIGDSLATDIAGANAYGIDSLMVLSGIHGSHLLPHLSEKELFQEKLETLSQEHNSHPTYVMERVYW
jgi:HAD superfamily hydrolase (TIGR01459 family)